MRDPCRRANAKPVRVNRDSTDLALIERVKRRHPGQTPGQ